MTFAANYVPGRCLRNRPKPMMARLYYQRQSTNRGRTPRLITSSIPFGFGVLLMESRPEGLAHRRHLDNCQLEPKDSFSCNIPMPWQFHLSFVNRISFKFWQQEDF